MTTLHDVLRALRDYAPSVELRAGAGGAFGEEGRPLDARALLDALPAVELARPAVLTWDTRHAGYVYLASDPLGWVHLFDAPGKAAQAPAVWVMERSADSEGGQQ